MRHELNNQGEMVALGGWVTLERAAEELGTTRAAVYETVRRYRVPIIQVGRTLMVRLEDYERAKAKTA